MKDFFDIHRISDVPDPLAGISEWPAPPRRRVTLEPSPTRSRLVAVRATALAAALLSELAWAFIISKREDLHTMPRTVLVTELAIPIAVALLALAAAAGPGARGMGQPKGRMTALVFLAPALFVAATLVTAPADVDPSPFLRHSLECFAWTGLISAVPIGLAAWVFRRSFVTAPAWRGAALGMACGATGATTMGVVCSVGSAGHVLLGHGTMMLVAALGGAWLASRFGRA
jgi:hypothetical protein